HAAASARANASELAGGAGGAAGPRPDDALPDVAPAGTRRLDPLCPGNGPPRGALDPHARGAAAARPCGARLGTGPGPAPRRARSQTLEDVDRGPGRRRGGSPGNPGTRARSAEPGAAPRG